MKTNFFNNILRITLTTSALTLFLTGCGENFQATYTGSAQARDGCTGIVNNPYSMEMQAVISGDSTELVITKFYPGSSTTSDATRQHIVQSIVGSVSGGTAFVDTDQRASSTNDSDRVDASATISADRSQITNFVYTLVRNTAQPGITTPCTFRIEAALLTKKQ